jgi:hypothetical protein
VVQHKAVQGEQELLVKVTQVVQGEQPLYQAQVVVEVVAHQQLVETVLATLGVMVVMALHLQFQVLA